VDAAALVDSVLALSRSHAQAPGLDVFDLVMQDHKRLGLDFAGRANPRSAFDHSLAVAFDPCVTRTDWSMFTDPQADPSLRDGCMGIWPTHFVPRFEARYAVTVKGV
jgi:hypothetical protein